jgi:hypothetical protein
MGHPISVVRYFNAATLALLLFGGDGVFGGLGYTELDYRLGLDLDGFAGLGVTAYAGFAVGFHQAAEAGDYEDAVLFGFFHGYVG